MTNHFYKVMFQEDERLGVGQVFDKPGPLLLPDEGEIEDWEPLLMELRNGDFPDYLASNRACRLCSERLRRILEEHASQLDVLQWLDVVVRRDQEDRRYFILHFPKPPDVLSRKKTILADKFVVKAVLSKDMAVGHRVFGYPGCGPLPLFISEKVKLAIEKERCTGMEIARAAVA